MGWAGFILLALCVSGCRLLPGARAGADGTDGRVRQQIRLEAPRALTAGAARVEITPAVGTPLAGYSKRRGKPSVGIRDPLYVRALALSDGEDTVLILSADLLVFPQPLAEELIQKIATTQKVPPQAILLTCTHTHSGSGAIAQGFLHEQVFGPYQKKVVAGLTGRISWAVQKALERREPVQWGIAQGPEILAGLVENRAAPGGAADAGVAVIVLEGAGHSPKAILVQATAHPTLLDGQDLRFSGDFPGEVSRRMEEAYPGSVCLFVNGAAGDSRPVDAIGSTADERIARFGGALAEGAQGLLSRTQIRPKADLAAWGGWFPLPPPRMRLGPIPLHPAIGRWMRPSSVFLNLAALGDVLLVPLPAEMTAELGRNLKKRLRSSSMEPVLFGFANGYLGYAVSPMQYQKGSYEASMTWYGPQFGRSLIDHMETLADLLQRD